MVYERWGGGGGRGGGGVRTDQNNSIKSTRSAMFNPCDRQYIFFPI